MAATTSIKSQVLISMLLGDKLNSPGIEFGLEAGFNWSIIEELDADRSLSAFNLGFYFDIRIKEPWFLYTGIVVKSKMGMHKLSATDLDFLGVQLYPEEGDYSQIAKYFLLPVMAKYKFKNHIYLKGGLQFGLMRDAYVEFNSSVEDTDARIRDYNTDNVNRIEVGAIGGAGYRLLKGKGISLGVMYYYGFIDFYKDRAGSNNQSLFVIANIPIGGVQKEK